MKEIIEAWFAESFYNTPVSNDTIIYNIVFDAKNELIKRLETAPEQSPAPSQEK